MNTEVEAHHDRHILEVKHTSAAEASSWTDDAEMLSLSSWRGLNFLFLFFFPMFNQLDAGKRGVSGEWKNGTIRKRGSGARIRGPHDRRENNMGRPSQVF